MRGKGGGEETEEEWETNAKLYFVQVNVHLHVANETVE